MEVRPRLLRHFHLEMVAIWSMLFCDACGNLLPRRNGPQGALVPCDDCGTSTKGEILASNGHLIVTLGSPYGRYFCQAYHFKIEAECISICASHKAFRSADHQCGRTEHGGYHTEGMPAVQKARDVLPHEAASKCRRGQHRLLQM